MNDQELVLSIVKLSGGKENIKNVSNCMTRLRFELKDGSLCNVEEIKKLDGVLGVVADRINYPEIVLGPGKCRKCAEICREQGLYSLDDNVNTDWKKNKEKIKSTQKNNFIKTILKSFGEVFVPLIPGTIVAGICAGVAMLISQVLPDYKENAILSLIYNILSLINISFMTYINAWAGYRAAEKFGATPILGGMLGMMTSLEGINEISKIFGLFDESMPLMSVLRAGKGGILAIFISVVVLSKLEKWIRMNMPENLDTICSPLLTIVLSVILHILVIMPSMGFVSTFICDIVEMGCLSENVIVRIIVGYVSSLIFLPLVSMGMHHGLIAIYSIQLEKLGFVTLYPSLAMAGAGQVGAAIALYIIAKKLQNKQICKVISGALPAGILGIGEPLIYGVTLPLGKPFITAGLGAGFGGAFTMLKQVASTTWGPSGILALFIMTAGANSPVKTMVYYSIGLLMSVIMGFLFTYLFFDKKELMVKDIINNNEISETTGGRNLQSKNEIREYSNIDFNKEDISYTNNCMKVMMGKSATTGIAMGKIVLWENVSKVEEKKTTNIEFEIKRFEDAYNIVINQMKNAMENVDEKISEIIAARIMMLEDNDFIVPIKSKIKEGYVAEYAVMVVGREKAKAFEIMDNEYLHARKNDIMDISNKLVSVLCDVNNRRELSEPAIIVAEEITPEEIADVNNSKVLAFVTRKGAYASHASIVAGNYAIPYIFGIDYDEKELKKVKYAIVDADKAAFVLNPDNKIIKETNRKILEEQKRYSTLSIKNIDNKLKVSNISVYANISEPEDVDLALENGASGIGLYRTEFLYMKKDTAPTEEEQFEAYKTVLTKMGDKEVIIRTMDIGADKPAKCLNLSHEENPALGLRAIRICLYNTELFRTQLRALFRAAIFGNEKIMFPMIANPIEIDDIKEQMKLAEKELKDRNVKYKIPHIGIMIETPAAAILSSELAKKVDFFSIGTNDLTQYTLAVDRTGKNLDRFYRVDDEAVLRLIKMTVDAARVIGIPVGICGEIAGNINVIPKLVELGVNEFSMAPTKILNAKQKIIECIESKNQNNIEQKGGKKDNLVSPVDGEIIPMDKIPDKAFSSGELGKCVGINPENDNVYAPCKGVILSIAETKHAICIKTDSGKEILIHVGIDTVTLKGRGFDLRVEEGDTVGKGDMLLTADLEVIKNANLSPIVIIAIIKE